MLGKNARRAAVMHRDRDLGPSVNSAPEWVICALLALAGWAALLGSPRLSLARARPGLRAGFPGECVRRWGAARTKVRRITRGGCPPRRGCRRCWPGPREFELTVGQQLAASHHPHPLISTTRCAGPSRCAPCPARRLFTRVLAWTAENLLCDAFPGFRRRPSAAVRRWRSGSIHAVSVVPRRRTAAHRCARIARLATAARCRRCCRRPATCRQG